MTTPSDPVDSHDSAAPPDTALVRTSTTDPGAVLGAASIGTDGGPVLAVLATLPRERFERRLSGAGYDAGESRVVGFVPQVDRDERSDPDEGGRTLGDVAGLSMALVGRFDGLAEEGGTVYLDSLEPFVAVAGLESTFRFLVIVAARAGATGVPLVARLDPDAVGPVAAGTLSEAFDRVLEAPASDAEADATG